MRHIQNFILSAAVATTLWTGGCTMFDNDTVRRGNPVPDVTEAAQQGERNEWLMTWQQRGSEAVTIHLVSVVSDTGY